MTGDAQSIMGTQKGRGKQVQGGFLEGAALALMPLGLQKVEAGGKLQARGRVRSRTWDHD